MLWLTIAGCVRSGLPGQSHRGPLPPADADLEARAARIEATVQHLAGTLGPRSAHQQPRVLAQARDWIRDRLEADGYQVELQPVVAYQGIPTHNVIARLPGAAPPLVVGAHYDTVPETPGADDNASGVAVLLELARALAPGSGAPRGRAVELVAWTTEEPPFFATSSMGSAVHADSLDAVYAAVSIESVGMYSDEPHSQARPFPLSLVVPSTGDFVAFVSNPRSHDLVRRTGRAFREAEAFPTFGGTAPAWIQGIDWSDHRSYWSLGAPTVMITDTAVFRTPNYHRAWDTPDQVDPMAIARVSRGVEAVVLDLITTGPAPTPSIPTLERVQPDWVEMTRGGRVVLHGSGFDEATRVRVGGVRVPVRRLVDDGKLVVWVEDLTPGTHDVGVQNEGGEVVLPASLSIGLQPPPPAVPCEEVVYFGHDSAEVPVEAARTLERARFCFTAAGGPVRITGFTDATGEAAYNETLGRERAEAVRTLLERFGVASERLEVHSAGEAAGPFPPEQRRRVEVVAEPDAGPR